MLISHADQATIHHFLRSPQHLLACNAHRLLTTVVDVDAGQIAECETEAIL